MGRLEDIKQSVEEDGDAYWEFNGKDDAIFLLQEIAKLQEYLGIATNEAQSSVPAWMHERVVKGNIELRDALKGLLGNRICCYGTNCKVCRVCVAIKVLKTKPNP